MDHPELNYEWWNIPNIVWSVDRHVNRLTDIIKLDGQWYLLGDTTVFVREDEQWKPLDYCVQNMPGETTYHQAYPTLNDSVGSGSETGWDAYIVAVLKGGKIYTAIHGYNDILSASFPYAPVETTADNFGIRVMSGQFDRGIEPMTDNATVLIAGGTEHKQYRLFCQKNAILKTCEFKWIDTTNPHNGGIKGDIRDLISQDVKFNPLRAGYFGDTKRYRYRYPENYLLPNGQRNPDVYDYWKFSTDSSDSADGSIPKDSSNCIACLTCMADDRPSGVIFKKALVANTYRALASTDYETASPPENLEGYLMECMIEDAYIEWDEWAQFDFNYFGQRFVYGNKTWADSRTEMNPAARRVWSSDIRPIGLDEGGEIEQLAIWSTIEDGDLKTYYSEPQGEIERNYLQTSSYTHLRETAQRAISAIGGSMSGRYCYAIIDEAPYIRIYRWGPNDGIPWGLPKKILFYAGNVMSSGDRANRNNWQVNFDYRCFKHCEISESLGVQKYWCNPKWKKLVYMPYYTVEISSLAVTGDLSYELDYDAHNGEILYKGTRYNRSNTNARYEILGMLDPAYGNPLNDNPTWGTGFFVDNGIKTKEEEAVNGYGAISSNSAGINILAASPTGEFSQ